MLECEFCGRIGKNNISYAQHKIRCKKNPDRIEIERSGLAAMHKKQKLCGGSNQYTKAKELGLSKPEITNETRKKIVKHLTGRVWSKEKRERHSKSMSAAVLKNPDSYSGSNVCGRVKVIEYNGTKLHGSWELLVAEYFDAKNIKWEREIPQPFTYKFDGTWHLYFPDFYLSDYDVYVEVKGYKRDKDIAKWCVVPRLVVIQLAEIKAIKKHTYDIMGPIAQLVEHPTHDEIKESQILSAINA